MNDFTPRAQQVLALARKEAERFNHNYVGTEHLLLGLIKLGQGVAVTVLQKMGLDLETVRMEVEKNVGSHPETNMIGNIPYTPRVKKVLALADKEAKALNHSYVGTEHILLGLLREGEGVAARVLKSLEVDPARTRNEILKVLDPNFAPPESEAESPQEGNKRDVNTPALRAFGRDLTELAKKGGLDPVIGRKNEIERVIQIPSAAGPKTTQCCSVKQGLERPPSSKGWLKKPRLGMCRNCCAINASSRSISR
jgi:ATP-dependent Clp protease ATP-binding subunit ClpC